MLIDFLSGTLGFFVGLFGFANIALPLFYTFPKVRKMAKSGEVKRSAILGCFTAPAFFTVIIVGLYFLMRHFNHEKVFVCSLALGVFFHIVGLLRPGTRSDIKSEFQEFIERYKLKVEEPKNK